MIQNLPPTFPEELRGKDFAAMSLKGGSQGRRLLPAQEGTELVRTSGQDPVTDSGSSWPLLLGNSQRSGW